MADAIERAARAERVRTDLAFRLVRGESAFDPRAVSPVGAIGLTQMMLPTAAELQPGITRARLFERDTNLRLGFRYFRRLLRHYDGDVETALHAYNRGIGTVARIRARGGNPANGYADKVLGDPGASRVGPATADTRPLPPPPGGRVGPGADAARAVRPGDRRTTRAGRRDAPGPRWFRRLAPRRDSSGSPCRPSGPGRRGQPGRRFGVPRRTTV